MFNIFSKKSKTEFPQSAQILSKEGFSENYTDVLRDEILNTRSSKMVARGNNYLMTALIIRGKLKEADEIFSLTNIKKLNTEMKCNFYNNYILSKFLRDEFDECNRIYTEQNEYVLAVNISSMRRTVGIHEYIAERFDNAVTVFLKLDDDVRFRDLVLVKTFSALDMKKQARTFTKNFSKYENELKEIAAALSEKVKKT
jgi:hypothetical protein